MGCGIGDTIHSLYTGKVWSGKKETWVNVDKFAAILKLAKEISYVALGVLVVLSAFFSFVFSPLAFMVCSTSSIVFTILGYYQENINTEKKLD